MSLGAAFIFRRWRIGIRSRATRFFRFDSISEWKADRLAEDFHGFPGLDFELVNPGNTATAP